MEKREEQYMSDGAAVNNGEKTGGVRVENKYREERVQQDVDKNEE